MAKVYDSDKAPGDRVFLPVERLIYRILRVEPEAGAALERLRPLAAGVQPRVGAGAVLLPAGADVAAAGNDLPNVDPKMAWNTAVSFVTNTNWQSYSGESTMGHLVQMAGLAVQNFVSAAVGMCIVVALIRGLGPPDGSHARQLLGRPHPHHTRILLPISFVIAWCW